MSTLDEILSDKEPAKVEKEAPPPEPKEKPAPEIPVFSETKAEPEPKVERVQSSKKQWEDKEQGAKGRVRDPATGQFLPKPEAELAPKEEVKPEAKVEAKSEQKQEQKQQEELTAKEKAYLRAAQDERGKRQALERQIAEAKGKEPEKKFWDDPEAALASTRADVAKTKQEMENLGVSIRLNTAETIARSRHPDFDEKVAVFTEITGGITDLAQQAAFINQWMSAPDPAEYAYKVGKNHMELKQAGNLDQLRANIEKETEAKVRAKIETELKEKEERLRKERDALPGSISEARGTGGSRAPVWGGPTPLDDILK